MSLLEVCASLLGLIAVWLTVRQNPWCWPVGLVMVVLYGWVFFQGKLYSNMLLQLVYAGLQLYGWWHWTRRDLPQQGLRVSRLDLAQTLGGLAAGLLGALLLGYLMARYTDAAAPWQDATLCAFSLVAQLWMAKKRLQCWPLWIVLDLLFVVLFLDQGLYLTAALYALFTLLACNGWLSWRRDLALPAR
ncbi:nicotinamide riboside transporter PnuC [Phytopseudomonas dryadis]|uniref:Nicotinamide riboside transporter PnuC n=1 Tax=Phytopseudomonas dryadis TaxID=2487520 RepID=A0A4Q9RCT4_9GAMM|nr:MULTISPECIES: nicotinamide riboside transporter PnuC [Pseudomonas]TBU97702.1 aminotransferase [Pseudomonas dryadis]TBV10156.1 aminotransferase [Pseudomonas dryadis]TBV19013.1 aminotransferase [Pseudomonas sp. FRB 230]